MDDLGLPRTIDSAALSVITGVGTRRLHQLISDSRISIECKDGDGQWLARRALTELFGYYRRQAEKGKQPAERHIDDQLDLEELRSRRIKNARAARELLPRHVYTQVWGELITTFKNRFLAFSAKMGPRAFRAKDKVEASELLDAEIREIFLGLCDPKVMEDIASSVRDDDFLTDGNAPTDSAPAPEHPAEDLEPPDA